MSELGEALTAAHRRAQRALTGRALKELAHAWALVDPADSTSWVRYLERAEVLCTAARGASAHAAGSYLEKFRLAELRALGIVADGFVVPAAGSLLPGEIERTLRTFGPAYVERLTASGMALEEAKRRALSGQLGQATNVILEPGRQRIDSGMANDRKCIGYRRNCSGAACSFCAMLASRGAVYKDAKSARGRRKGKGKVGSAGVHNACMCTMEPVYSYRSKGDANAQRAERLWKEANGDPLQFRRLIEGRA